MSNKSEYIWNAKKFICNTEYFDKICLHAYLFIYTKIYVYAYMLTCLYDSKSGFIMIKIKVSTFRFYFIIKINEKKETENRDFHWASSITLMSVLP